jgi:DnaD/phage-associated family protein
VQRNYQEARRGAKRDVIVDKNIWLLEKSDTLPFIKVACKDDSLSFSEKNGNKSGIYPQRREEEKKEDIDKNKTKKNRAKSACDDVLKKILEKLESCNIYPSSNTIEAIQSWLSDTDTEVVMYAIDEADKRSKRSWSYVEAILRRLKADGLKTIEQIKERDSNYKASNKRFTDKDTSVFQPDGTDYADIERRMNKLLDEDYDEYAAAGIY